MAVFSVARLSSLYCKCDTLKLIWSRKITNSEKHGSWLLLLTVLSWPDFYQHLNKIIIIFPSDLLSCGFDFTSPSAYYFCIFPSNSSPRWQLLTATILKIFSDPVLCLRTENPKKCWVGDHFECCLDTIILSNYSSGKTIKIVLFSQHCQEPGWQDKIDNIEKLVAQLTFK